MTTAVYVFVKDQPRRLEIEMERIETYRGLLITRNRAGSYDVTLADGEQTSRSYVSVEAARERIDRAVA